MGALVVWAHIAIWLWQNGGAPEWDYYRYPGLRERVDSALLEDLDSAEKFIRQYRDGTNPEIGRGWWS